MKTPGCRILLVAVLSLLLGRELVAKHIVGGVITYTNSGNGNYHFTMKIYRDCNCTDCAGFDSPARIAIYRGNAAPYTLIDELNINLDGPPVNIPAPDFPCLIPPDICVEEGVYEWDMDLPVIAQSYHIVYQRCCRNVTINNIYNPDNSGATYSIEILPAAQALSNNSPVFSSFPPTVICANEPLNYNHSATDVDGDQLVYEMCAPLLGGGIDGGPDNPGGDAGSCTGVQPNPPCPPPFLPVNFIVPAYTSTFPMGGAPPVTINVNNGIMTGTPTVQGQFVVGVCVSEYRNGQLLSVVRRDFQFNVALCEPTVVADIEADTILNGVEYLIRSCGDLSLDFENNSFQQQFIDEYAWVFDLNGTPLTINTWDASVTFPDTGIYYGLLLLNPGTTCADTAFITTQIYPSVNADFIYSFDTCVAGPVAFNDESFSEGGPLTSWGWDFDDGDFSGDQNPLHLFNNPGIHDVTLRVTDINLCEADTTKTIVWYPAPPIIIIEPSTFSGCEPATVFFNNLSFPIDSTYTIVWDFGDGTNGYDISPTHVYEDPGIYSVHVSITSPIGCFIEDNWPDWINVEPSPIADFSYTPGQLNSFQMTASFVDESIGAASWLWNFNMEGVSTQQNPQYTFRDTGIQVVQLIVTHQSGCMDTIIQYIDVEPIVTYFLPNAFTPNYDDVNDFFLGAGYLTGMTNFRMTIWNRWGELIFETDDPAQPWNGRKFNTGEMSPNGVYVCVVNYTGPRGQQIELKGFATLIR